jgi:hypothetical protein
MAGTALIGLTAGGRPGSGAKSVISGVSGVSGAKSKVSLASAMTAGTILAKDKLAQVRCSGVLTSCQAYMVTCSRTPALSTYSKISGNLLSACLVWNALYQNLSNMT